MHCVVLDSGDEDADDNTQAPVTRGPSQPSPVRANAIATKPKPVTVPATPEKKPPSPPTTANASHAKPGMVQSSQTRTNRNADTKVQKAASHRRGKMKLP